MVLYLSFDKANHKIFPTKLEKWTLKFLDFENVSNCYYSEVLS